MASWPLLVLFVCVVAADDDGAVCDERAPATVAVFSRRRHTCDEFCASGGSGWTCGGAQDVNYGCSEFHQEKIDSTDCAKSWGTKICVCVDDLSISDEQVSEKEDDLLREVEDDDEVEVHDPALTSLVEVWEDVVPTELLGHAMKTHLRMHHSELIERHKLCF